MVCFGVREHFEPDRTAIYMPLEGYMNIIGRLKMLENLALWSWMVDKATDAIY